MSLIKISNKKIMAICLMVASSMMMLTGSMSVTQASPTSSGSADEVEQEWKRYNSLLRSKYKAGRYEDALDEAKNAYRFTKRVFGENNHRTLSMLSNVAALYKRVGKYNQSLKINEDLLQLKLKKFGKAHKDTLLTMNNLASLYHAMGKLDKSLPLYVDTLKVSKKILGEDNIRTVGTMHNLATLYIAKGRYPEAEPLLKRALRVRKKTLGPESRKTLYSMSYLGLLYKKQGRYKKAENVLKETLKLKQKVFGRKHPKTIETMTFLADLYDVMPRTELALELYREIYFLNRTFQGEDHPDTIISMNGLAGVYDRVGNTKKAEELFIGALAKSRSRYGEGHPNTKLIMNDIAVFYHNKGRFDEAERLYKRVLSLSGGAHRAVVKNLVSLYVETLRYAEAEKYIEKDIELTNKFFNDVLWGAGESTRVSYLKEEKSDQDYLFSYFAEQNNEANSKRALELSVARKGLLLQISRQIKAVVGGSKDKRLNRLMKSLQQKRQLLSEKALSGKADKNEVVTLEDEINDLQAELSKNVGQLSDLGFSFSAERIINAIESGSVFVDYISIRRKNFQNIKARRKHHLLALVVNPDASPAVNLVELGEIPKIEKDISVYRKGFEDKEEIKPLARSLYNAIWQPLLPYIDNAKNIYLSADGVLNILPFSSLITGEDNYLVQEYKLTQIASGRDLVMKSGKRSTNPSAIFSGPLYDAGQAAAYKGILNAERSVTSGRSMDRLYFSPLTGALREGVLVQERMKKKSLPVQHYSLAEATESNVASVNSPAILHLATHGFFLSDVESDEDDDSMGDRGLKKKSLKKKTNAKRVDVNPLLRSGLALVNANIAGQIRDSKQNGILTADEVLDIDLDGTNLVVLSACNTGLGDVKVGEGVYGLRRAFQEAGAKSVLSTLWPISDQGTMAFMKLFYKRFLSGESSQQALRNTQKQFLNSSDLNHPYYWAPFVMMGKD